MASTYTFEALAVHVDPEHPHVLEVALNRPEKLNAFNSTLWHEMKQCIDRASADPDVHSVLIHGGTCRIFTAGLDLESEVNGGFLDPNLDTTFTVKPDASRRGLRLEPHIITAQEGITCVERCRKPVVVALHGAVVGAGVDLATACDIRYCTEDAFFCIAEVNVGLAADVGTLQRLPKIVGNDSIVRELALTGRKMDSSEARALGLVGNVFPNRDECLAGARSVARLIAKKSPIAVIGTKASLNYSRDHSVQDGLNHIREWNMLHLQSDDFHASVKATLTKTKPKFARL